MSIPFGVRVEMERFLAGVFTNTTVAIGVSTTDTPSSATKSRRSRGITLILIERLDAGAGLVGVVTSSTVLVVGVSTTTTSSTTFPLSISLSSVSLSDGKRWAVLRKLFVQAKAGLNVGLLFV